MRGKEQQHHAQVLDDLERFLWLHQGVLQDWHLDEEQVREALREAARQEERFAGLEEDLWDATRRLENIRDEAW